MDEKREPGAILHTPTGTPYRVLPATHASDAAWRELVGRLLARIHAQAEDQAPAAEQLNRPEE